MQPAKLTQADVATCDADALAAALRLGAADVASRLGAVEILAEFGDLLMRTKIRDHIIVDEAGRAYVKWRDLHIAATIENNVGHLSSTAQRALLFACALAAGTPMISLNEAVASWGTVNRVTAVRAFAFACDQPDHAATVNRIGDLAQALAADGDRTLTARAAGALIASVLTGSHIRTLPAAVTDNGSSAPLLGWMPASREEIDKALAAVIEISEARARLSAAEQTLAEQFGYSGRWDRFAAAVDAHAKRTLPGADPTPETRLYDTVLDVITIAGTDGIDKHGIAASIAAAHIDADARALTQVLVRLTGPDGPVVYALSNGGTYYLREDAAPALSLPDAIVEILRASTGDPHSVRPGGASTDGLIELLRTDHHITATRLDVAAACGELAARGLVEQPEPHGPYYLTGYVPTTTTTTTTTGPATPFEQPPTLTRAELDTLVRGNLTAAGRDGLTLPAILTAVTAAQGGRLASSGVVLAAIDRIGATAIDGPPGTIEVRWTL